MLGLALLSALILSCISGPLLQKESTAQQQASQLLVTDYAVDINTSVPLTAFKCFQQYEHKVAFIRAYHPSGQGQVDQNATGNIQRARAAGLVIEAYMVPQPNSNKSGRLQFDEMYNNLMQSSIAIHSVWIQVSTPAKWPLVPSYNIAFLNDILLRAGVGLKVGIYTNSVDWSQITGGARINNAMLWYWSVRGNGPSNMSPADFNDFSAFGGWTVPSVKQFVRADTFCGVTLNRNVYDTQMPIGVMANKEKSKHIIGGTPSLARSTFTGIAKITAQ